MKNIRSHFVFNRSQRNGIFLLVLIIIILQGVYFFGNFSSSENFSEEENVQLLILQQKIDSIRQVANVGDTLKIYPFNPNFLTDYRGYILGLSVEEIDKLHAYRKSDLWINSAKDFQKVTGVHDSLLKKISPYFKFPEWVSNPSSSSKSFEQNKDAFNEKGYEQKQELNEASVDDLMKIKGIGEVLAGRIVNYRSKIGGFLDDLQLKDIYGLNYEVRGEVLSNFTVKNPPQFEVIDINKAGVLELSEVPYINYELAREIVDYRLLHEKIESFEELANIKDFPSEKIDRIALYLAIK